MSRATRASAVASPSNGAAGEAEQGPHRLRWGCDPRRTHGPPAATAAFAVRSHVPPRCGGPCSMLRRALPLGNPLLRAGLRLLPEDGCDIQKPGVEPQAEQALGEGAGGDLPHPRHGGGQAQAAEPQHGHAMPCCTTSAAAFRRSDDIARARGTRRECSRCRAVCPRHDCCNRRSSASMAGLYRIDPERAGPVLREHDGRAIAGVGFAVLDRDAVRRSDPIRSRRPSVA